MLLNITQLIALFGLFIWATSKLSNKNQVVFYFLATVFSFLLAVEASSVYLINQPFGYQYWINVNFDLISTYLFQFYVELVFACIFLVFIFGLLTYLARKVSAYKNIYWNKYQWTAPIACLALLSVPNGIFHLFIDLTKIQLVKSESLDKALSGIGINSGNYVFPDQLKATSGKNIVVISMESLEKGFLNQSYSGLDITPRLNRLAAENKFYDMQQAGGNWTAGSLYTTLTGLPPIFKSLDNGNLIFQDVEAINFSTLGKVLNKAGYQMKYLMSNAESAGIENLLKANSFEIVTDKIGQNLGHFKTSNDYDLFEEAKKQVDVLNNKKQPFALFISTINSHFPRGVYDSRMEKLIKKKKSDFKNEVDFSVMATDYLVGDFIDYLKKKNILENTVFYIYPDHAMMGNGGNITKLQALGRSLYIVTNAKNIEKSIFDISNINQLHIPRIITSGSEVDSNVKFPVDFPSVNFKNRMAVATLNASINDLSNYSSSMHVRVAQDNVYLDIQDKNNIVEIIDKNTKWVNFVFSQSMRFIEAIKGSENFIPYNSNGFIDQPLQFTVFLKNKNPTGFYFGNYKNIGRYQSNPNGNSELFIGSNELEKIKQENILTSKNINHDSRTYLTTFKLKSIEDYIEVTSSEFNTLLTNGSKIKIGEDQYNLTRGISLLFWNKNRFDVKTYDVYASNEQAIDLIRMINSLQDKNERYVLVASDSLNNTWPGFQEGLRKLGLNLLASLHGRLAYVGYYGGTQIFEFTDSKTVNKLISFYRDTREWKLPAPPALNDYLRDKNRFIAHAGGIVNGKIYTDSLEALNHSYSQGLRLFELDISVTSDGYYVAAHDWQHWAKITGYKGALPPSKEVFLREKIYDTMTPLDMTAINDWFKAHPDAILVTDKVNEPRKFAGQFIDKKRLMMELFDVNSVLEGVNVGILAPIPTGDLWGEIYTHHKELISQGKIKYIAANRKINKLSIYQMLDEGLKIYAFNINTELDVTERWVACNERNLFYGMYVDNPDFLRMDRCN